MTNMANDAKADVDILRRLSPLIDQALDLEEAQRESWLAGLTGDDADLLPLLRRILASMSDRETADILLHRADQAILGTGPAAEPFAPGDTVGPYRLLTEIGRGGMGDVWLAERSDGALKRTVALKLPVLGLRRHVLLQRFERERDILGGLAHPNIARLYDAGLAADGQPYLALEYVKGQPITEHAGDLDVIARVRLLRQAMAAVQYAHANLVIHRDLKPSNLLVTDQGQVMLLDFGIAKLLEGEASEVHETELTQLGGKALTLHYAAPEQLGSGPISIAVDVWALGVLLYELASGQRPFASIDHAALQHAILEDEPARASRRSQSMASLPRGLRTDLDTIILKALKKSPHDRYPTVSAFADDLDRWLAGEPVLAQKDSPWYRARKFLQRNRLLGAVSAGALLALVGGFGVALWQADVARQESARARDEASIAQATVAFLTDVFTANSTNQADPLKARQTTARELLDIAAAKIDSKDLGGTPEARAYILRTISDMYGELGLKEKAVDLGRQRLALLESLRPSDDVEIAEQQVELSALMQASRYADERGQLLRKALAILELHPDGHDEIRLRVLRQLALFENDSRDSKAVVHADAAVALAETRLPAVLIDCLLVQGVTKTNVGDDAGAEAALVRAARLAETSTTMQRRQRIQLAGYLGDAQARIGKIDEAEATYRQGRDLAVRINGEEHTDVVQMEYRLGNLLFDSGRTRDGLALLAVAKARVLRLKGPGDRTLLPLLLFHEGRRLARYGHIEEANADADAGLRLFGDTATAAANRAGVQLLQLKAELDVRLGRRDDVGPANVALEAATTYSRDAAAQYQVTRCAQTLVEGDLTAARRLLQQHVNDGHDPGPSLSRQSLEVDWGSLALGAGDAILALKLAKQALAYAGEQPQHRQLVAEAASALAGRALLQLGDAQAAYEHLRRAANIDEQHYDPALSLRLADTLIALAEAAEKLAHQAEARTHAQRARRIYRAHPQGPSLPGTLQL
jgi:serine/threonine-protein kinase